MTRSCHRVETLAVFTNSAERVIHPVHQKLIRQFYLWYLHIIQAIRLVAFLANEMSMLVCMRLTGAILSTKGILDALAILGSTM